MHLCICIPAYNEAESIGSVLRAIPKNCAGIKETTICVVDDGSSDATAQNAHTAGADIVIEHQRNRGLAAAFATAQDYALHHNCDALVILDADGQYDPEEIPKLLEPLQKGEADIVIGNRQVRQCRWMPWGNRYGNMIGSLGIRWILHCQIDDASSGFRALTRDALEAIHIHSRHTYTHEMLMHGQALGLRIANVPISFSPRSKGQSKLIRTLPNHLARCTGTIIRCMLTIAPLKTFGMIGVLSGAIGFLLLALSIPALGSVDRLLLFLGTFFLFCSLQSFVIGLLATVYKEY